MCTLTLGSASRQSQAGLPPTASHFTPLTCIMLPWPHHRRSPACAAACCGPGLRLTAARLVPSLTACMHASMCVCVCVCACVHGSGWALMQRRTDQAVCRRRGNGLWPASRVLCLAYSQCLARREASGTYLPLRRPTAPKTHQPWGCCAAPGRPIPWPKVPSTAVPAIEGLLAGGGPGSHGRGAPREAVGRFVTLPRHNKASPAGHRHKRKGGRPRKQR